MEEPTQRPSNERLRMALRLRLSLRRAGSGRQGETVFIPNPTRAPVLRAPGTEDSAD
jgi:hypothetical protein